ncbi:disulfide bond formation protein B [Paraburkholderia phosphatilytica]|uniref:disulfide bond formation protein B n=1 Tax=Paraburkholderia phosphatilytica TaxID=2282883 RepID=UPI000E4B0A0A|nr:disulfide bond formation protein B [Paraburkholderia phosphatilytica]
MINDSNLLRRERSLLVLLGMICIALVGGALYMQYVENEDPCPLCIIQRYFFLLVAIFAFLGARFSNWRAVRLLEVLALLSAAAGIATALRHLYVLANPGFSCGFDALEPIVDGLPPAHWLPGIFKVSGLCETPYPPILHLSLPAWSLVGFAIAFISLAASLWLNRRRG